MLMMVRSTEIIVPINQTSQHSITQSVMLNLSHLLTKPFTSILIQKSQQDTQVTEFILSDDCSTCFGYHYHPTS
jgi:hypothetical protein